MRPVMMGAAKAIAAASGGGGGGGGGGGTITFTPAPGTYSETDNVQVGKAQFKITASASVKWNWSATGSIPTSTVANGGSASSITFTLSSTLNNKDCTISVTSGTKSWTINLATTGSGGGSS